MDARSVMRFRRRGLDVAVRVWGLLFSAALQPHALLFEHLLSRADAELARSPPVSPQRAAPIARPLLAIRAAQP